MARKMTNKQKQFLDEFEKKNRIENEADRFLNGGPYKNGSHILMADHMSDGEWMSLVGMNDYETLWQDVDRYFSDLCTKKKR